MSRTYRKGTGWYTNRRDLEGRNKHIIFMGYSGILEEETWEEHLRDTHKDGAWNMSTPSWWIHDTSTIKERVKTRMVVQKIYKLIDYEDSPEFPLDKKPYVYYW